MPKNKTKEKLSSKNKKNVKNKKSKSIKSKILLSPPNSSRISSNKIKKQKTELNNNKNNFFSSKRVINKINNELDNLYNDLNLKFKYYNIYKKIFQNNYNSNEKKNINTKFLDNNKSKNYNSEINYIKIKAMDNLYLYKQKNISHRIYKQPELLKSITFNNKFKHNSFCNLKYSKIKPNVNTYRIRNSFIPSIYSFSNNKTKKFNINNINNACKILLEKD